MHRAHPPPFTIYTITYKVVISKKRREGRGRKGQKRRYIERRERQGQEKERRRQGTGERGRCQDTEDGRGRGGFEGVKGRV